MRIRVICSLLLAAGMAIPVDPVFRASGRAHCRAP